MSEQTSKQAEPKAAKPAPKEKTDTSAWTTALEAISGDNKLMSTLLKVVLSPLGIIAALCGLGYLLWKNKTHKDRIKELETALHTAQLEIKGLEKDLNYLEREKRNKRYKEEEDQEDEPEYRNDHLGFVPLQPLSRELTRTTKRKSIYLD